MKLNIERLRSFCASRWPERMGKAHGVGHWDRVAKFGELLYQEGVDMDVVMAFAYLHDSQRGTVYQHNTCIATERPQ